MLTGGDEKPAEKPAVEAVIKKQEIKKDTKEIVAKNTTLNE
jgi:hypothetical protein